MIYLLAAAWWSIGTATLIYLTWDREAFTWGNLLTCLLVGIIGPLVMLAIAIAVLKDAAFWNDPIFGKRRAK